MVTFVAMVPLAGLGTYFVTYLNEASVKNAGWRLADKLATAELILQQRHGELRRIAHSGALSANLESQLKDLVIAYGLTWVAITDTRGGSLAQAGVADFDTLRSRGITKLLAKGAVAEQSFIVAPDPVGSPPEMVAIAPIRTPAGVVGYFALGQQLGGSASSGEPALGLVSEIHHAVQIPVLVLASGGPVLFSDGPVPGIRFGPPATSIPVPLEGLRSYQEIFLQKESFSFLLVPLTDFEGKEVAVLGLGLKATDFLTLRDATLPPIILFLALSLVLVVTLAQTLSHWLSRPLVAMLEATGAMIRGDFARKIDEAVGGEVGDLAKGFNQMSSQLSATLDQLSALNADLEQKVAARTEELQTANETLSATVEKLQHSQAELVEAEKLATLGQLMASVSHELNTPLGALSSALGMGPGLMVEILQEAPELMRTLDEVQGQEFRDLLGLLTKRGAPPSNLSRDRRDRTQLVNDLSPFLLSPSPTLVEDFLDLGLGNDLLRYPHLLRGQRVEEVARLAVKVNQVVQTKAVMESAVEKASQTIFNLKDYLEEGDAKTLSVILLDEQLEGVIRPYRDSTPAGLLLHCHLRSAPGVLFVREKLARVWKALLKNALEATDYRGTIEVTLLSEEGWCTVTFQDPGPGVPEELQHRLFTPFFTTKGGGTSLGLSLSLAKTIITSAGGTLHYSRVAGKTQFTVRLPGIV